MLSNGNIPGFNEVADVKELFVDFVYRTFRNSSNRQKGRAVQGFNAQSDISSAPIVNIIRECTYGMQDRFRIPVCFELNTSSFYNSQIYQIINVDWYRHVNRSNIIIGSALVTALVTALIFCAHAQILT
jgi:hypothetical protein